MPKEVVETFWSVIGIAVALWAYWMFGDRLLDTPRQHQERLACEMRMMAGEAVSEKPLQAADAEAYCDKELELERGASTTANK